MTVRSRAAGFVAAWLAALAILSTARAADDWPCFHGVRRDNKSDEKGLLASWPEGGPKLLWTASGLGKGYSSVAVSGGAVYTAGKVEDRTFVFAFDLEGHEKWRAPNGAAWKASGSQPWAAGYDGSRSTPTVSGGRIYHLRELGRLATLDAATGRELWTVDLLDRFKAEVPEYGYCESPLADGDRIVLCPGGADGYIAALDAKTGGTLWATKGIEGPTGNTSLVPVELGGRRMYLGMSSRVVFAVDAKTGARLWSFEHANQRENNCTDPICADGRVYATSGYGKGGVLLRMEETPGGVRVEKVWESKLLDDHHGGVILDGGCLYGSGHESKGWFCLDFKTGEERHRADGKGSLTYADGCLYCLDESGVMSLVRAAPERREVLGSFKVPSGGAGLHWAHPVVCGGRLYVRHADKLFAYDVSGR